MRHYCSTMLIKTHFTTPFLFQHIPILFRVAPLKMIHQKFKEKMNFKKGSLREARHI